MVSLEDKLLKMKRECHIQCILQYIQCTCTYSVYYSTYSVHCMYIKNSITKCNTMITINDMYITTRLEYDTKQ